MSEGLVGSSNLFDFFHDRVVLARGDLDADIHDDTVLYLARLLADRAHGTELTDDATLAELHGRAAHSSPGKQASTYRELGDRALYLLGFFREYLDRARRPIGPGYYVDMGIAAYDRCDQVLKRWFADAFGPVFTELSRNFEACVQLLATVRGSANDSAENDLAKAYERWMLAAGTMGSDARIPGRIILLSDPDVA